MDLLTADEHWLDRTLTWTYAWDGPMAIERYDTLEPACVAVSGCGSPLLETFMDNAAGPPGERRQRTVVRRGGLGTRLADGGPGGQLEPTDVGGHKANADETSALRTGRDEAVPGGAEADTLTSAAWPGNLDRVKAVRLPSCPNSNS